MSWRLAAMFIFVSCMSSSSLATLSPATAVETERLRTTFTNELSKYDQAHNDSVADLRRQYAAALGALEQKLMSAGALDAVLAIKKESARFAADHALRAADVLAEPVELQALQRRTIEKMESLPGVRAAKVVRLADLYVKSLRTMEENLTKKAMLDDAIEIKAIREGVPALPAVAGASFILSMSSQTTGGGSNTVPVSGSGATQAVTNATPIPDRKAGKKYTGSSSVRIRDRFDTLLKAVRRQDWAGAEAIVDPAKLKSLGSQRVEGFMRGLGARFGGENENLRVELRNIVVSEEDSAATGDPGVKIGDEWREIRGFKWIQTDGDWYIDIQATVGERRDFRRDDRGGRGERGQR